MKKRDYEYDEELDELEDEDLEDDDDDDEDDGIQKKLKKLNGKLNGIALFLLIIGLIGLASLICAFTVGGGLGGSSATPEDFYGTYYANKDNEYRTFYIGEDECYQIASCGFDLITNKYTYEKCEYMSASMAQMKMPNENYDGCPALFLYESSDKAVVLWITETEPENKLVLNANDTELSKEPFNFKSDMNDKGDYLGRYEYSTAYVEFKENGKAKLSLGGTDSGEQYDYVLVSGKWYARWMNTELDSNSALILFKDNNPNNIQTFEIIGGSKLRYGTYVFDQTESYVKDDADNNYGDNSGDNSDDNFGGNSGDNSDDNFGGNSGDNSDDTVGGGGQDSAAVDWDTLLDFDNVTVELTVEHSQSEYSEIIIYKDAANGKWRIDTYYHYLGTVEAEKYYADGVGYGGIHDTGDFREAVSAQTVISECNEYLNDINDIDHSTLEKISDTVYSSDLYTINLGFDGKIESIASYASDNTYYISNQGTTSVPSLSSSDGSGSSGGSQGSSSPDWDTLLDFDNVTVDLIVSYGGSDFAEITIYKNEAYGEWRMDTYSRYEGETYLIKYYADTTYDMGYCYEDGVKTYEDPDYVVAQCEMYLEYLYDISPSTLEKESDTVYSNSDYTITLDYDGTIESITLNVSDITYYISNQGTTVVDPL